MGTSTVMYRTLAYVAGAVFTAAALAQPLADIDDHGDDPSTATVLGLGETATGAVDRIDEDFFHLDLPRRTTVVLSGTGSVSTTLLHRGEDYESCLAIHIHGRSPTRRELAEGTYYLKVSDSGQSQSYELAVHEAAPDDHGDMPETATEIALDASVNGEIDPVGDTDFFRFELSERTTVEVFGSGVERYQSVRICEPEQRDFDFALADDVGASDHNWRRRELEVGTYYLAVRSHDLQGSYEIGVRDIGPDDHGDSPDSATHLSLAQSTRGTIYPPRGDIDFFRFNLPRRMDVTVTGSAGAGIDFALVPEDRREFIDAMIGVYAFEDDGPSGRRLRAELDAGSYYLRVWASSNADEPIAVYRVLVVGTPADDHGNTQAAATDLVLGETATGGIDPHDDTDFFRLDLEQRATVVVAVTGIAESAALFGGLIDADGEVVSVLDRDSERAELRLRGDRLDPGTYFVELIADEAIERYEVTAREAEPDDHGDRPDTATAVMPGAMAEGTLDRYDDVDYYRVDLARPSVLLLSVSSDFDNVELTLFDADGELISEGYGFARTDLRTRVELEPGTYYVSVASYLSVNSFSDTYMGYFCSLPRNALATGRYRLSIWDVPPDDHGGVAMTATELQLSAPARGEIDPREDRDVYRLEIARPTAIVLDVIGRFRSVARILNADGEEVAPELSEADGGSVLGTVVVPTCNDLALMLPQPDFNENELQMRYELQPGVYYVEVASYSDDANPHDMGWYEIVVREPEPEDR